MPRSARRSSASRSPDIYRLVRRVRERWVLVGDGRHRSVMILFVFTVQPVVVEPLFNDYQPLPAGEVRDSILALAKETGVPVDDVYWFDASKQTKRISANVSGLGGTARIALNDNLLHGTSLPEIRAVMGHEMGHYRLHHGTQARARLHDRARHRLLRRSTARSAASSGATATAGASATSPIPAGLPLAFAIFIGRDVPAHAGDEHDGPHRGAPGGRVRARCVAKEPHGFASVAMRLSTYRKLEPGALEEVIFYDHPERAGTGRAVDAVARGTSASAVARARDPAGHARSAGTLRSLAEPATSRGRLPRASFSRDVSLRRAQPRGDSATGPQTSWRDPEASA